tara:strand:+ start:21385 stop:22380 length:996 start_codon:yes stop_codon:yes gene_type:complete
MPLKEEIKAVKRNFLTDLKDLDLDQSSIETLKNKYFGRKGKIALLFLEISSVDPAERPNIGKDLNRLKSDLFARFNDKVTSNIKDDKSNYYKDLDVSLPGIKPKVGSQHVLEKTLSEIKGIFKSIGFHVRYGPEVDDDYHNFTALNIPEHHPARDMQDTFFVSEDIVLRTHTSNVQIHLMELENPPLKYIIPGRVFRNEAVSYKSYCLFHQVEGIYINRKVSFSELKGCIEYFIKQMFGPEKRMRFRPSYFPFTEPSAEVDIWDDDRKQWLEILGCGMVDPNVLKNVGYDKNSWKGYAFGMGVERIAMLKYRINDIRLFYSSDIRFMKQFK